MGRVMRWLKGLFGIKKDEPQIVAAATDAAVTVAPAQAAVAVCDEDCRKPATQAVTLDMEDEAEEKRLSVCLSFDIYLSASFAGIADEIGGAVPGRAAADEDDSEFQFSFVPGVEEISDPRSSEADEVEGSPAGRCMKSGSTGWMSKPRKFRDLLRRGSKQRDGMKLSGTGKRKAKAGVEKASSSSADEAFHGRKRASKERDNTKSYLPYRRDLLGLYANAIPFPVNPMVFLRVP